MTIYSNSVLFEMEVIVPLKPSSIGLAHMSSIKSSY